MARPGRVVWGILFAATLVAGCAGGDGGSLTPPTTLDPQLARCSQSFGSPTASPYVLPYPVGRTYGMFQGACPVNPAWGHYGWLAYDFDLAIGDSVLASRDGTVFYVEQRWPDSDRVCGHENGVWIQHEDGSTMGYVHFTTNGARVAVGERVKTGQLIGLSGDSGCSSGPHLHVSLFRAGNDYGKTGTIPLNFRNADGPHDARQALLQGGRFTARTY